MFRKYDSCTLSTHILILALLINLSSLWQHSVAQQKAYKFSILFAIKSQNNELEQPGDSELIFKKFINTRFDMRIHFTKQSVVIFFV